MAETQDYPVHYTRVDLGNIRYLMALVAKAIHDLLAALVSNKGHFTAG
jgi:hypothetical protein